VRGAIAPLDEAGRSAALEANSRMASRALRVLAVAYRGLDAVPASPDPAAVEHDLVFVGLVGMMDPARPEASDRADRAADSRLSMWSEGCWRNRLAAGSQYRPSAHLRYELTPLPATDPSAASTTTTRTESVPKSAPST